MENEREFILNMLQDMPTDEVFNLLNENYLIDIDRVAREALYDADDNTIKQVYSYLRDEY